MVHHDDGSNATRIEEITRGDSLWEREAWRVALLANELGLTLKAETLILADMRELMAWRCYLQQRLTRPRRRPAWLSLLLHHEHIPLGLRQGASR